VANIYFPLGLIEKADIFSFEKIKSEKNKFMQRKIPQEILRDLINY